MAGIGDYEEGKPFALKSGNKPTFKNMGSSPNNYGTPGNMPIDNFGANPSESPYTQKEEEEKSDTTTIEAKEGKESGWKKALKIGVAGLTGGLDAVYGTGKVVPLISHVKKTKEIEANPVSEEITKNIKEVTGLDTDTDSGDDEEKMPKAEWDKGEEKAKDMGHDMDDLLSKQKSLEKGSQEWKDNQNLINEALGNKKRH